MSLPISEVTLRVMARPGKGARFYQGRAAETIVWPELSPDGRFVAYRDGAYDWPDSRIESVSVRVVRVSDGAVLPFDIRIPEGLSAGRSRWMPDALAIAFVGRDQNGVNRISVQNFVPGRDTTDTRRPLGGFALPRERSRSASRLTAPVSRSSFSSLLVAERVPGIPARR